MPTSGRAYQTTPQVPITAPSGTLLVVPPGKRVVITGGTISVTEVGAALTFIQMIGQDGRIIFHAPQSAVGVYRFGPYERGIELTEGADVLVTLSGVPGCYAQIAYYLENTYLG